MKVVCHMITTADGHIAHLDGKSVSTPPDWEVFVDATKRHNNFVVGRKTLDAVGESGFDGSGCDYKFVVSSEKGLKLDSSFTVVHSPQEAISFLQDKVDTLFLVGGSELNTAFAKQEFIDVIVLIVEPFLIGKGINLWSEQFDLQLELADVQKLEGGRLQIKYKVKK